MSSACGFGFAWYPVLAAAIATVLAASDVIIGWTGPPPADVYVDRVLMSLVFWLCPGGKERMRRLMAMVANRRVDLTPLVTHRFALGEIEAALDVFGHQRDGVMKVALYPALTSSDRVPVKAVAHASSPVFRASSD